MRQLLIQLLILLSLAAFLDTTSAAPNICQSPECLKLSAFITSSMNSSADPCEDFEKYACGNYKVNNLYDPKSVSWSKDQLVLSVRGMDTVYEELNKRIFELLLFPNSVKEQDPDIAAMNQLAGNLFRSCVSWQKRKQNPRRNAEENERETSSVVLNGILEHLVESFHPKTQVGWFERAIAKMVRLGGWSFLEIVPTMKLVMNKENISADITRVRLNGYIRTQDFPVAGHNFLKFLSSLPSSSGFNFSAVESFLNIHSELQNGVVIENVNDSVKLQRWAKCPEASLLSQPGNRYTELTINDLNNISKCADDKNPFDWSVFFDGVLDGNVNKNDRIQFGTPENAIATIRLVTYFKRNSISGSRSNKFTDHIAYLTIDWMTSFLPLYSRELAEKLRLRYALLPYEEGEPIKECIKLTKWLLSPVVERMHLRSQHKGTLERVRRLVDLVQNATIASVRKQAWITPASKDAIIDKIISMKKDSGFDNVPDSKLKAFYATTARSLKKSNISNSYQNFGLLLAHAMGARAGRQNNLLSSSGDVLPDSFQFSNDKLLVSAFSRLRDNEVVFPIGILSPTIYHHSYPEYFNLGGVGVIIGHEIGHGFDKVGHELTKTGYSRHFWDKKTEAGYVERMKCVKSRYGSYELVPGERHNSVRTLSNDIADLMGIQAAHGAMKLLSEQDRLLRLPNLPESLTTEKLFFIQAAQTWCEKTEPNVFEIDRWSEHSPSHLRIRGMMQNSKEFAAAFQCKTGQAMNPRKKCEFW